MQKAADRHWTATLTRLRRCTSGSGHEAQLAVAVETVTDPRAVPRCGRSSARGSAADQSVRSGFWVGSTRPMQPGPWRDWLSMAGRPLCGRRPSKH